MAAVTFAGGSGISMPASTGKDVDLTRSPTRSPTDFMVGPVISIASIIYVVAGLRFTRRE
jgi:hypothetical protein